MISVVSDMTGWKMLVRTLCIGSKMLACWWICRELEWGSFSIVVVDLLNYSGACSVIGKGPKKVRVKIAWRFFSLPAFPSGWLSIIVIPDSATKWKIQKFKLKVATWNAWILLDRDNSSCTVNDFLPKKPHTRLSLINISNKYYIIF